MTQAQVEYQVLEARWSGVKGRIIAAEAERAATQPQNPEFEQKVERGPDGRFAPKPGGSTGSGKTAHVSAAPKEYQAAVETISQRLKAMDPESAAAFQKVMQSKDFESLQGEIAKALTGTEVKGAEKGLQAVIKEVGHQAQHAATDVLEHAHPSTSAAIGLGLVFDGLMGGLVKELDGLTHLEDQGETKAVGEVGRLAAGVMGPILILYGNLAPELLLGAAAGDALITASVSTVAVMATNEGVTKKLEEGTKELGKKAGEKAHEVIPAVTPEMGEAIAEKVVETVLMTLSAATAREGYMRLKAKGAEGKTLDKLHESLTHIGKTGDQARDMIHNGDSAAKIQQHLEANLPKSTVASLNKVSQAAVKAKKGK